MPRKTAPNYTEEFKEQVLAYAASNTEESVEDIAARFGVTSRSIRNWQRRAQVPLGAPQPAAASEDPRAELRRLRRENERLRMTCEILKKTVVIFGNPSAEGASWSKR